MSASAVAKVNTSIFKRIPSFLNDANIILLVVNHITKKIEIGFNKTKAEINYLKQDENVPGGKAPLYLSNYLIKLETGSKLKPDKKFYVKGFEITGKFIKSRSTAAGVTFDSVFDQINGYDNILSNYQLLDDTGRISGSAWKSLDGYEGSFRMNEVREKYNEEKEFREQFDKLAQEELENLIPEPKILSQQKNLDYDEENDLWIDNSGEETVYYKEDEDTGEFIEVEVEIEEDSE